MSARSVLNAVRSVNGQEHILEDQNTFLYRMVRNPETLFILFFKFNSVLLVLLFCCTSMIDGFDDIVMLLHLYSCARSVLALQINENQQAAALGGEVKLGEMAPLAMLPPPAPPAPFAPHSGCYYGGESSSTALQLTPAAPQLHPDVGFRLQPTQPNLQDPACGGLHGHGLQLW